MLFLTMLRIDVESIIPAMVDRIDVENDISGMVDRMDVETIIPGWLIAALVTVVVTVFMLILGTGNT